MGLAWNEMRVERPSTAVDGVLDASGMITLFSSCGLWLAMLSVLQEWG